MMTWHKYDFVPDSYSQNMMMWHKYDFVPIIYVGCAETPVLHLLTPFVGLSKPVSMPFPSLNISELEGSENRETANRNRSLPSPTMQKSDPIQIFRRRTPFVGLSNPVSMPFHSLNISELEY